MNICFAFPVRVSPKPVHQCYTGLLNLGERGWIYACCRTQWQDRRRCPSFENEEIYQAFRLWQKQPRVRSRKELRRQVFRGRRTLRPRGDRPRGD